jgi:hypothetical protein
VGSDRRGQSAWARERTAFPNYLAGTWGPPSADELPSATAATGVAMMSITLGIEQALAGSGRGRRLGAVR